MGFFQNLFSGSKPEEIAEIDYSVLGVDMHSHLIPGIDDGAQTMADSMLLIRELHDMGFSRIITTPHIMGDSFKNTPEIINAGLDHVREALEKENIPVKISAAAEYYIDDLFEEKLRQPDLLTLGDKFLLIEVSYINKPENLFSSIFEIQSMGLKVILAHPERYPFYYHDFDEYKRIRDLGVLLQVNTNSLCGYYGKMAKVIGEKFVSLGMVDFIGTDCHHMRHVENLKRSLREKSVKKLLTSGVLMNQMLA